MPWSGFGSKLSIVAGLTADAVKTLMNAKFTALTTLINTTGLTRDMLRDNGVTVTFPVKSLGVPGETILGSVVVPMVAKGRIVLRALSWSWVGIGSETLQVWCIMPDLTTFRIATVDSTNIATQLFVPAPIDVTGCRLQIKTTGTAPSVGNNAGQLVFHCHALLGEGV